MSLQTNPVGRIMAKKKTFSRKDHAKVIDVFKLLDNFINNILNDVQKFFQMTVFEHVPKDCFEKFKNIHVAQEFRNTNALVPQNYLDNLN